MPPPPPPEPPSIIDDDDVDVDVDGCGSSASWTPFDCLPVASQTPSGLLLLEETEVDVLQRSSVQLRSALADPSEPIGPPLNSLGHVDETLLARARRQRQQSSSSSSVAAAAAAASRTGASADAAGWIDRTDSSLSLQLTTHRVVWWKTTTAASAGSTGRRVARFLHLGHVLSVTPETSGTGGIIFPSSSKRRKLLLSTYLGDFMLVLNSGSDATDVLAALQRVLERKEWSKSTARTLEQAKRLTSHKVGVDAVLAKSKIVQQQEQKISDQALAATDADELLREATELARIIRKHVAVLERNNEMAAVGAAAGGGEADGIDPASQQALVRMLQDMGMASALSKKDTLDYYGTIARQLADLLLPRIESLGGVITLTDVYCLINRARSSHLLSPEDLLRATEALEKIDVGLKVRTFRSGLVVLQDARVDDDRVAGLLRDACAGGMTALEASRLLKTTPLLAEEQLCSAEQRGYLARDEQVETLRFFPNLFDDWAASISGGA